MDPPHTPFNFHINQSIQSSGNGGGASGGGAIGGNTSGNPPEPTNSPPQSVPGRRTPLGAVGLGGFYAQGGHTSASSLHTHTDENRLGGQSSRSQSHGSGSGQGLIPGGGSGSKKNRQGKTVRLNINAR